MVGRRSQMAIRCDGPNFWESMIADKRPAGPPPQTILSYCALGVGTESSLPISVLLVGASMDAPSRIVEWACVRRPWREEVVEVAILETEKDCAGEAKASMALVFATNAHNAGTSRSFWTIMVKDCLCGLLRTCGHGGFWIGSG